MIFLLDILALAIVGICVWMGYKRGFILSLSGFLVIILSIVIGGVIARNLAPQIAESIEPYIGWLSEDATDEAIKEVGEKPDLDDENSVLEISTETFKLMGLSKDAANNLAKKVWSFVEGGAKSLKSAVSQAFTGAITYILIYIVIFAIVALILSALANIINSFFSLPGLNLLNKVGGIVLGGLYGLAIVFVIYWFLRFLGILIPQEEIERTLITKLFIYLNPVKLILGI